MNRFDTFHATPIIRGGGCPSQRERVIRRDAFSILEVLVAFVLLSVAVATFAKIGHRYWLHVRQMEQHAIARDVLYRTSRLIRAGIYEVTPENDGATAERLKIDDSFVETRLPAVELTARIIEDELGRRVRLSLDWDRPHDPPPMTLDVWFNAEDA